MSDQKLIIGYYRLSMEDDSEGESNSIINQRKLVKDYISNIPELASMPFQEFYDDGYSGSSIVKVIKGFLFINLIIPSGSL